MHQKYKGSGVHRKRTRLGYLWKSMKDRSSYSYDEGYEDGYEDARAEFQE